MTSIHRTHRTLWAVVLAAFAMLTSGPAAPVTALAKSHPAGRAHVTRHHVMTRFVGSFPVTGFAGTATRGTAYVNVQGTNSAVRVQVSGLAPMTVHAIHIHAGSCASPYGGVHLYILGFLQAGRFGTATVQGMGPMPYVPGNRYVIVYAGTAPATIIGCATLGFLHPG